MQSSFIPQSYEAWRHCITKVCQMKLTPEFIDARIKSLQDGSEQHTQQFVRLYGEPYHQQVLNWFNQAKKQA